MPQVVLENVTFSYINVWEPRADLNGNMKFSACILIDKNNAKTMEVLQNAQKAAIEEGIAQGKWTAAMVSTLKLPIRDGDKELATERKSGEEYVNRVFINANAAEGQPPGIVKPVGGKAVPIKDPLEFYSGCKGHAYLSFYPYKVKAGAKGIAVGLNGLYKLEDGDRLDGRVSATKAFAEFAEKESDSEPTAGAEDSPFS